MMEMVGWDMIDVSVSMLQLTQIKYGPVLTRHYGAWPSQAMPRFPDVNTALVLPIHLPNVNGHQKLQMQSLHTHSLLRTLAQYQQGNIEEYVGSGIPPQDGVQYQAAHMSISVSTVLTTQPSTINHTRQSNALVGKPCRARDSTRMPSDRLLPCY